MIKVGLRGKGPEGKPGTGSDQEKKILAIANRQRLSSSRIIGTIIGSPDKILTPYEEGVALTGKVGHEAAQIALLVEGGQKVIAAYPSSTRKERDHLQTSVDEIRAMGPNKLLFHECVLRSPSKIEFDRGHEGKNSIPRTLPGLEGTALIFPPNLKDAQLKAENAVAAVYQHPNIDPRRVQFERTRVFPTFNSKFAVSVRHDVYDPVTNQSVDFKPGDSPRSKATSLLHAFINSLIDPDHDTSITDPYTDKKIEKSRAIVIGRDFESGHIVLEGGAASLRNIVNTTTGNTIEYEIREPEVRAFLRKLRDTLGRLFLPKEEQTLTSAPSVKTTRVRRSQPPLQTNRLL